ncbi:ABC transporter substrate-binding protein, partial [Chloroflexota bacterium]
VKEEEAAEGKEMVKDFMGRLVEKPKYGGVLNVVPVNETLGWDQTKATPYNLYPLFQICERLVQADWTKGPAGTNETTWVDSAYEPFNLQAPCLAESWEMPEPGTFTFQLRKGVHFALDPNNEASRLVGGREMTADDVVYTLNWVYTVPTSYYINVCAKNVPTSIKALDKYTVEVKCPDPLTAPTTLFEYIQHDIRIIAPEVVEKYGDYTKWENCVGTGPFMVVDFVSNSSTTFVRNPNYWQKDPVHPENQLPYVDGLTFLPIADVSTLLAALRTGKVDQFEQVSLEDKDLLLRTRPDLQFMEYYELSPECIYLRCDKPESPLYDVRVRQAMHMSIDRQAMVDNLFGGKAQIFSHPVDPSYKDVHVPLEQQPESVQELFEYNPDKAKQLLAEAGYPDGFKCDIISQPEYVDWVSVFKEYFADIGVDMEIQMKEYGVWRSIGVQHSYDYMYARNIASKVANCFFKMIYWRPPDGQNNRSCVNDPYLEERFLEFSAHYWDYEWKVEKVKELVPYVTEKCWIIQLPNPAIYSCWQPWVKGYHGEVQQGYLSRTMWTHFVWLDQDLKAEMTGKR